MNHKGGCPPGVDCSTLLDIDPVIKARRITSITASTVGSLSSFVGDIHVRDGKFLARNGSYYNIRTQGFNQFTGKAAHMNRMVSSAKVATRLTRGLGALNIVNSGYQLGTGQINATQFGIEFISTGIGTATPPLISVPWIIGYEGIGRWGIGRTSWYRKSVRPWVRRNIWGIKD